MTTLNFCQIQSNLTSKVNQHLKFDLLLNGYGVFVHNLLNKMSENLERKVYSEEEKMLLLSLIENYKNVIECKKTDGVSLRKKQDTWAKITKSYNSHNVTKRNTRQLKKLWDNIKHR